MQLIKKVILQGGEHEVCSSRLGQCGSNIADSFYSVNSYVKSFFNRKITILTDGAVIDPTKNSRLY